MRSIKILYLKEMLDLLRDRRAIISIVMVPLVLWPLLTTGMSFFLSRSTRRAQEKQFHLALKESVSLAGLAGSLEQAGFQVKRADDPRHDVENKVTDMGVEVSGPPDNISVKIYADLSQLETQIASGRIERALDQLKTERIKTELERAGIAERILTPFTVDKVNTAPPQRMTATIVGAVLGYMIVISMIMGGMYPGIDLTAGEKERKTIEMLLSSPASREEIVLSKMLAVITSTLITSVLAVISLGMSLTLARRAGAAQALGSISIERGTLLMIGVVIIPTAIMISSIIIAVATQAKSYKEAQSYLSPLLVVAILPSMVSFLPGIKLSAGLALIPIVNFSQLVKELILGDWSWIGYALTLGSTLAYAAIAFFIAVRVFKNERILFRT
ncbi:MAG: ABC transporter permease [Blastocatellia bacterium]|nr:ABC transporter permease [Blastocatellia bacterium]